VVRRDGLEEGERRPVKFTQVSLDRFLSFVIFAR
jgi:hypothetical protein